MGKEAPTRERMEEALRAFLTGALATIVVLAAALVFQIIHERTDWPLGQSGWEIANIVAILVLMLAFGTFALARWGELVRQTTERKRAEEAIQESEERFRRLAENAPDIIFRYRLVPTPGYEYISPAVTGITGYTPQEFYADPDLDFKIIHPDDRQILQRMIEQPLGDPRALRWIRKDGAIAWLEHHNAPIYDEEDNLVAVEGIARDVTEHKRAEDALRENTERLLKAQRVARMGFLDWNLKTNDMIWSDQVYDLYGVDKRAQESSIDLTMQLVHPDDLKFVEENLEKAKMGEKEYDIDHRKLRSDGKVIWVHAQAELLRDADGNPESLLGTVVDITERKRMEEAIRESEERFRGTLDGMMEGCQIIGFDWRYLYVNDAVAKHGRRAKEELLGRTMVEMYPGIDGTEVFTHLKRCMDERVPHRMENQYTFPDGGTAWFELAIQPVPEGIFVLTVEITERKQAEEELRESEERFRRLAENAADIIFRYRLVPTPGYGYISPAVTNITGYTPDECYANPHLGHKIAYLDDVPIMDRFLEEADSSGRPFVTRMIRKDGMLIWIEARIVPIHDEGGNLVAIEGILRDVTERKRAEEELWQSEQRLRSIFEATFEGIAIHENGVILDANPAFERMFGYPLSELVGKSVLDLAAEESRALVMEKLTTRAQEPFEAIGMRKDGATLTVELIGKRHTYKGRGVTVTTLRDVTDRKRMEEALQAAREELEGKVERQLLRRNPYGLTFRELTVLHLVAVGESDKQIGLKLGISHFTAQKHTSNILGKMGAGSRTEAAARALREGLLD